MVTEMQKEKFFSSFQSALSEEGYLKYVHVIPSPARRRERRQDTEKKTTVRMSPVMQQLLAALHTAAEKGMDTADRFGLDIKEGETSPPKRYNSGSMILAMENAGQLIEDEELRAQIKGSGIGTSATRAEILKKLVYHQIYCSK